MSLILASLLTACGGAAGPPGDPSGEPQYSGTSGDPEASAFPPSAQSRAPVPTVESSEPVGIDGSIAPIDAELRDRLVGRNWHPGCPVPIGDLRLVEVRYRNLRGEVRFGPLVVHEDVARDVRWVLRRLFRARFPIHRIGLPPRYRPPRPEDRESRRNLTSSFNCRPATGNPGSLSHHSYGWAIDINPLRNPYVRADGSVLRDAVLPYVDRSRDRAGMIHEGDIVVRSFAQIGWGWGGRWETIKDYMHFSLTGR